MGVRRWPAGRVPLAVWAPAAGRVELEWAPADLDQAPAAGPMSTQSSTTSRVGAGGATIDRVRPLPGVLDVVDVMPEEVQPEWVLQIVPSHTAQMGVLCDETSDDDAQPHCRMP